MQPGEQHPIVDYLRFVDQLQDSVTRLVYQLTNRLVIEEINFDPIQTLSHV